MHAEVNNPVACNHANLCKSHNFVCLVCWCCPSRRFAVSLHLGVLCFWICCFLIWFLLICYDFLEVFTSLETIHCPIWGRWPSHGSRPQPKPWWRRNSSPARHWPRAAQRYGTLGAPRPSVWTSGETVSSRTFCKLSDSQSQNVRIDQRNWVMPSLHKMPGSTNKAWLQWNWFNGCDQEVSQSAQAFGFLRSWNFNEKFRGYNCHFRWHSWFATYDCAFVDIDMEILQPACLSWFKSWFSCPTPVTTNRMTRQPPSDWRQPAGHFPGPATVSRCQQKLSMLGGLISNNI